MMEHVAASDWETWAGQHDAVLLDIREPEEWAHGTLPGATLIPMTELVDRVHELPKDREILCICRSGNRSERVAAFLIANGFEGVANMTGGMHALGMQV